MKNYKRSISIIIIIIVSLTIFSSCDDLLNPEQELAMLRDRTRVMEAQLNEINARIRELDTGGTPMHLIAGVDTEKCNGCSKCLSACPVNAVAVVEKSAQIDSAKCPGCGQCVIACPRGAISLEKTAR